MDASLGMPWHSLALRSAAVCYYLTCGSTVDVVLLAAWALSQTGTPVLRLLAEYVTTLRAGAIAAAAPAVVCILLAGRLVPSRARSKQDSEGTGSMRPLLFPCTTTHSRMFPKKHSFSYSYLLVGIPVGWEGIAGGMVSAGSSKTKGWYHINAADYLERGNGRSGLRGKLDAFLESQNVDPKHYPYAYLVTAAKFLGYHFNPVSFWYLYSAEKNMTAMVLEVNNTFDERRMYFLGSNDVALGTADTIPSSSPGIDSKAQPGSSEPKPLQRAWPKDFHVSPFNSRKGAYSLVAHDPLAPLLEGRGRINNIINLSSSKNHAKLVARVFSEGDAQDPAAMSIWQKARFLLAWWWVGFVTFPRIVKEAGLLFFKRKLHVWYRPEPLKESLGRHADDMERHLEIFFRNYLRYLVTQCLEPLRVRYVPSGISGGCVETMDSPAPISADKPAQELEFKVLTPAFYSRFVYYAHDLEALFCELRENCTIWVSRPDLLPKLVFKKPPQALHLSSRFEFGQFKMIQRLRQRPDRIVRPMTSSQQSDQATRTGPKTGQDIREFRPSSMDGYVLAHEDPEARKTYRSLVLKLFIADRMALGSMDLLRLEMLIARGLLAWLVTR